MIKKGRLFLIPSPISGSVTESEIPAIIPASIEHIRHFIVEETRTARRYIIKLFPNTGADQFHFSDFNEHSDKSDAPALLKPAIEGFDVGLLSEAGLPCLADPGKEVVMAAHNLNIRVVPLPGSSSFMLALIASGFNGQQFTFHGYLPVDKHLRSKKIRELERIANSTDQTQIFMEAPYRNNSMLESLITVCRDDSMLSVSAAIGSENEFVCTKEIRQWKIKRPDLHKIPCVFILGRL